MRYRIEFEVKDDATLEWVCRRLGIDIRWAAGICFLCKVPREARTFTIRDTCVAKYSSIARTVYTDDEQLEPAFRRTLQEGGRL